MKKTIIATIVASTAVLAAPAQAELSASIAASNFYLWRGQNISNGAGTVSGSLDYGHESGIYAGVWTSGEAARSEIDVYGGWGGEFGGVGIDLSLWSYSYPETSGSVSYSDASEFVVGLSYGDFGVTLFDGLQSASYLHAVASYGYDMFTFSIGHDFDSSEDEITDYTYAAVGVAPVEDVAFTFSKVVESEGDAMDEDFLVNVTWSKSFEF